MLSVSVVVPSIPPRKTLLQRALRSIEAQTYKPTEIIVEVDDLGEGAASTKNKGLLRSTSDWTAFLDDDDEFLPNHLETLIVEAATDNYDVVYCAPLVINAHGKEIPLQPEWGNLGNEFDAALLMRQSYIGMFSVVRTDLAKSVGFIREDPSQFDDWDFFRSMLNAGARFKHVPAQTYVWYHVPNTGNTGLGNTSGKPDRWK